MILHALDVPVAELARRTGWEIKPQGACKGDACIPLPGAVEDDRVDARVLAERLGMPLVREEKHDLWCLGPEAGGRALATAEVPDVALPDRQGTEFRLRSLRGQKVFLLAWASW